MHCGRNVEETCIHEHDDNIIITTTTLPWKKTSVLADLTCEGEMGCDQVTHSSANNLTPITIFLQWKYLKYFSFGECCTTNEKDDGDVDEGNIMDAPKSHVINIIEKHKSRFVLFPACETQSDHYSTCSSYYPSLLLRVKCSDMRDWRGFTISLNLYCCTDIFNGQSIIESIRQKPTYLSVPFNIYNIFF